MGAGVIVRATLAAGLIAGLLPTIAAAADPVPSWMSMTPIGYGLSIEQHQALDMQMSVGTTIDGWATDATMTLAEDGVATPICVVAVDPTNDTRCTLPTLSVGTHVFTGSYSGNALVAPSSSPPVAIEVTPDLVHATGVTIGYSTFYPYRDGYRDTLPIKGARNEPLTVSIRIYNGSGTRVKTVSLARATGAYTYIWTGRNSAGSMVPSGKYKVVQKLVDDFGTTKTITSYATLSHKRLYWATTYVTKLGSSYVSSGTSGSASVTRSTTSGYAKLKASTASWGNWAGAGWQFTLPAAVAYKGLYFQVYHSGIKWSAPNQISMQNFSTCPLTSGDWDEACFDVVASIGSVTSNTTKLWSSVHGSATANRSGRTVRGLASVSGGTFYIYKARIKVTYGVLK